MTIRRVARAKVNLDLRIVGRRADGYHQLDSLVAFADCADEVIIEPAAALAFAIEGPFASEAGGGEDNLVPRAARALAAALGREPRASIRLVKSIPVAAGLGGGSADAAATMRGLCELWGVKPDFAFLDPIALALGADIPACLRSRPLVMRGVGEAIQEWRTADLALGLLLSNPRVASPTPAVFRAFVMKDAMRRPVARGGEGRAAFLNRIRENGNDLSDAAIAVAPAISEVLAALRKTPGALHVAMSGSGATCYALFEDAQQASEARAALAAAHPDWWSHAGALASDRG